MSDISRGHSVNQSELLNRIVRAIILIVVALIASITFVSFAVHHMRLQFEEEFKGIADTKVQQVTDVVRITINGDEIVNDKVSAAEKYNSILKLMLADTDSGSIGQESYVLFSYSEGALDMLFAEGADSASNFASGTSEISDWLNSDNSPSIVEGKRFESVIVPIADSTGRCVGIFEYKVSYSELDSLGDKLEGRILTSVILAVAAGIVLFIIQLLLPRIINGSKRGGQRL